MIERAKWAIAATLLAVFAAGAAQAQSSCTLQPPPTPMTIEPLARPKPPEKPPCVQQDHCIGAELERYNTAVSRYNSALADFNQKTGERENRFRAYIDQLNQYAGQTETYLNCEHTRLAAVLDAAN
jgi:hypothetical protein